MYTSATYKREKLIRATSAEKLHSKPHCIEGSLTNGTKKLRFHNFSLEKGPGHRINRSPKVLHYKEIGKVFIIDITFYLGDDDENLIDSSGETVICTLLVIKNYVYTK